jgi:hypothetical protein
VLKQSGYKFSDVVRLNVYTTDVDALFPHWGQIVERAAQVRLLLGGVKRLAFPELMVRSKRRRRNDAHKERKSKATCSPGRSSGYGSGNYAP